MNRNAIKKAFIYSIYGIYFVTQENLQNGTIIFFLCVNNSFVDREQITQLFKNKIEELETNNKISKGLIKTTDPEICNIELGNEKFYNKNEYTISKVIIYD